MSETADPLTGFTVAVTADRRRDELTALLERRGARVVLAPALRIVPPYYRHPAYLDAMTAVITDDLAKLPWKPDHFVLSFHGIPKRYAKAGDPYATQVIRTTRELIRLEAEMGSRAIWLSRRSSHGVRSEVLEAAFSRHSRLSDEQKTAIEHVAGAERIAAVIGRAGAGKTTMMKAAREAWEAAG